MTVKDGLIHMKNEKGQITLEAILIIGVFMLIFVGISVPMVFKAKYAAIDTTILSDAKFATEQIASVANTVVVNGSRRTIDVYIPGYKSGSIHIGTRICTDGDYLNTTVLIVRYDGAGSIEIAEVYNFDQRLYGGGWSISTPDGDAPDRILEDEGRRYTITIEYKNIISGTANTMTGVTKSDTVCTQTFTETLPGGWENL